MAALSLLSLGCAHAPVAAPTVPAAPPAAAAFNTLSETERAAAKEAADTAAVAWGADAALREKFSTEDNKTLRSAEGLAYQMRLYGRLLFLHRDYHQQIEKLLARSKAPSVRALLVAYQHLPLEPGVADADIDTLEVGALQRARSVYLEGLRRVLAFAGMRPPPAKKKVVPATPSL